MYRVNEIFRSIQGEGDMHLGSQAVFVRFSGCNMSCAFCDTAHEQHTVMGPDEIANRVLKLDPEGHCIVVFTGGEPLLQLDERLVDRLLEKKDTDDFGNEKRLAVETNGAKVTEDLSPANDLGKMLNEFEEVTVSPKALPCGEVIMREATTFKLLWPSPIPTEDIAKILAQAPHALPILQPRTSKDNYLFKQHCKDAVSQARLWTEQYSKYWRVIPQTHVFMGLR